MKFAACACLALCILVADAEFDYRVEVSYHSRLLKHREWSIAVSRSGERIYIQIDNYANKTLKANLSRDEYQKLVDFLNSRGIWYLKNQYPAASQNALYKISVQQGKYKHEAIVEAGPLLSGYASRFREIIRKMENFAKTKLEN
jgi:hypothetical protein